jgi:hypothetical protein
MNESGNTPCEQCIQWLSESVYISTFYGIIYEFKIFC